MPRAQTLPTIRTVMALALAPDLAPVRARAKALALVQATAWATMES